MTTISYRFAGNWLVSSTYYTNDMVISPITAKPYVLVVDSLIGGSDPSVPSPNWIQAGQIGLPTFGVYTEATGGSPNVSIPISGLTTTGTVSICYIHAGGGGGSQYTKSITSSANTCAMVFNSAVDIGDQIIWQVLAFS